MEDILEVLKGRRSVRRYKSDPVPEELLGKIVEAGLYAPTGMNRQETIILKITRPEVVRQLGLANGRLMGKENTDAFYGAPAVLCVLSKRDIPTAIFDGCSVLSNMMSCWIHRGKEQFETEEGKKILAQAGIDSSRYVGIDSLVVGYPDGVTAPASPRKEGRTYSIS